MTSKKYIHEEADNSLSVQFLDWAPKVLWLKDHLHVRQWPLLPWRTWSPQKCKKQKPFTKAAQRRAAYSIWMTLGLMGSPGSKQALKIHRTFPPWGPIFQNKMSEMTSLWWPVLFSNQKHRIVSTCRVTICPLVTLVHSSSPWPSSEGMSNPSFHTPEPPPGRRDPDSSNLEAQELWLGQTHLHSKRGLRNCSVARVPFQELGISKQEKKVCDRICFTFPLLMLISFNLWMSWFRKLGTSPLKLP